MSLISEALEDCVTLVPQYKPDGFGGVSTTWVEGQSFKASFDFQTSIEAKVAAVQGVTGLWDIYVPRSVSLEYHNVFRRKSDGQVFRVTSKDDKATPKSAGLDLRKVSAEEWALA